MRERALAGDAAVLAPAVAAAVLLARDLLSLPGGWIEPLQRARAWAAAWGGDPLPALLAVAGAAALVTTLACVRGLLAGEQR